MHAFSSKGYFAKSPRRLILKSFWWEIFSRKPPEKFPEDSSLRELFGKQSQIFLEGVFWKTTSNLPWVTFLENILKSSLRDFYGKGPDIFPDGKQHQIFLDGFFWFIRTWYLPWGRGRRTFWPLISGIGSGLLVLLKINWLQSHFRKRLWLVGSPENQLTTVLNIVVA